MVTILAEWLHVLPQIYVVFWYQNLGGELFNFFFHFKSLSVPRTDIGLEAQQQKKEKKKKGKVACPCNLKRNGFPSVKKIFSFSIVKLKFTVA